MKTRNKALTISLLAHASFVGCALALSGQAIPDKPPVVINFTMEQAAAAPASTATPSGTGNNDVEVKDFPKESVVEQAAPKPSQEATEKPVVQEKQVVTLKNTTVARKIKMMPVEESVPDNIPPPVPNDSFEPSSAIAAAATTGEGAQNTAPTQAAMDKGGPGPGKDTATAGGQYLQKNYEYIRKHIMDNLIYPATAQRMGMRGKVLVSFIINEGGDVDSVTIVSSCGHTLLDTNVINTIHKAAPFPKPPEKAQIILPIVYALKST